MTPSTQPNAAANDFDLGFVGGGHMASAIVAGLLQQGFAPARVWLSDPSEAQRQALVTRFDGVHVTSDNAALANQCEALVLAVKPQVMRDACQALRFPDDRPPPLILSIAAGVQADTIMQWLPDQHPVVRAMPNQGAALRMSTTGMYANNACSTNQHRIADTIMGAVGSVVWVDDEVAIDAITAVAGSGPAYVYYLMEAMQSAAESLNLAPKVARQLAVETAQAAAVLALSDDQSLETLRTHVTSPGGTTEAAVHYMQQHDFAGTVTGAIHAAHARAAQLAEDAAKDPK